MKTIINVGLGLALAFCLVFFVSGKFEEYVDAKVEAAVTELLGAGEQVVELNEQPNVNINAVVEETVAKAVAKAKKEQRATNTKALITPVPASNSTPKVTNTPESNREYIDVRGPKGAVKLYVGQPKAEVLELLGTPDGYNFGGTYEDCRYNLSLTSWISLDFKNGKLTKVNKY